jgi:DNA invertase Pin-like site-specific DNA recombinase
VAAVEAFYNLVYQLFCWHVVASFGTFVLNKVIAQGGNQKRWNFDSYVTKITKAVDFMYMTPNLRGDEKAKYLRKSQTDDPLLTVEEVLEKHEQMLDEWVERNQPDGGPVPEENTFREIGSGETISDRIAIRELLRRIESPKIKAIMVVEPSRLTRGDLEDIGYLVKILRYTNTLVITLQYTYDLNDERDRDLFERELMRGNEYLEYTKKIRMNGRLTSVKNGNFIGQTAPYGYKKKIVKEGKKTCHTLEPHPEEAPIVKRIFELYASGLGTVKIAAQLDNEHVPAPRGKSWSPDTLPGILNNVHYLGKVKWNERKTVRRVEDGEVLKSRPRAEEFLVFEGKHPAIIDQELWDAVHAIKGSHPKNHKARNLTNPIAGIFWCKCGRAMVARRYPGKDGEERCAPRVLCGNRKNCGTASAKLEDVLAEVVKVLQEAIQDFEVRIEAGVDDSAEIHRQMIERMERRLEDLKKLEVQQWKEKMKNGMPEHVFKELNAPTVAEIEELEHALCEAKDATPEAVDLDAKLVTFKAALEALQDPDAPVKEKNKLLKTCIERITYSRERFSEVGPAKKGKETPIHLDFLLRV